MHLSDKVDHILHSHQDEKEVQLWIFSLTPLGVAFAFFLVFMLPLEISNKDIILVAAGGAGFAGLQAYWIFRGWRREEGLTILLGVLGLAATMAFVWSYAEFLGEIFRAVFAG